VLCVRPSIIRQAVSSKVVDEGLDISGDGAAANRDGFSLPPSSN
jgi:hypothetical protein